MERILLLVSHRGNRDLLHTLLARRYQVVLPNGEDPLAATFDLAIIDGAALIRLRKQIRQLRAAEEPVFLPFLLITTPRNDRMIARELGTVIDSLVVTPIDKAEFQSYVSNLLRMRRLSIELKEQRDIVQKIALTDDVSGFHNTRFMHQHLDELLVDPRAQTESISLVFFDMDHFKRVVDTHGHLLGAKVLREVAELLDIYLDPDDRIVRYGGDEYVIILPWQTQVQAVEKVEFLRDKMTQATFLQDEDIHLHVTASFGIATYPDDADTKRELLAEADHCLFESKRRGKNRVTSKMMTTE